MADGKTIKVKGKKTTLYLGTDLNGDIPHTFFSQDKETKFSWYIFFKGLRLMNYPLKVLVSDGNSDIFQAGKRFYPHLRWQTCLKHYMDKIDRILSYKKILKEKKQKEFEKEIRLRFLVKKMLFSENYEGFFRLWKSMKYFHCQSKICKLIKKDIERNLEYLVLYYFDSNVPRTNNLIENLIKQYNRRLKTIEGFQSPETASGHLKLYTLYLRFRSYTDCRKARKKKNGKSKLELAGVKISGIDWLRFSQNY